MVVLIEDDDDGHGGGDMKIKEEPKLVYNGENSFVGLLKSPVWVAKPVEGLRDGGPTPFLKKTFEMVDDPRTDSIISWRDLKHETTRREGRKAFGNRSRTHATNGIQSPKIVDIHVKSYMNPVFIKLLQHLVQKENTGSDEMSKRRKFEQMLSMVNADELKQEMWNMIEPDACTMFSSDESVSPLEDQKTGAISGLNSSESFMLWDKLMEDELRSCDEQLGKDQTVTYLHEWQQLIPKV
ncbi:hypothetical protein L1987_70091 [Smallanthus sonchifolius]|uniref:Uncharacterized protein n=1 Tax=Smallanthus sonchifolius TaxID=185202 RepID=A0ACB9ANX8_9ASTR|nr:hypothetical protein L1987_70091 [Smallanthus sonchifolius]